MGNEGEERSEGDGRLLLIIYQVYYTSAPKYFLEQTPSQGHYGPT